MAFDLERIRSQTFVRDVVYRASVGSTNDLALRLAGQRETRPHVGGLLVLAERQTAGRGRGSHRWWSPAGALTFSLLVDPARFGLVRANWPQVSLTTAVAACQVVAQRAPNAPSGVRWPNDVYLGGRKVGGVLVEVARPAAEPAIRRWRTPPANDRNALPDKLAAARADRHGWTSHAVAPRPATLRCVGECLVVGVGLNVNNSFGAAPPDVRDVGTSLADVTGKTHDLTDVLVALLCAIEEGLCALAGIVGQPLGSAEAPPLCRRWASLNLLRDRHIELDAHGRMVRGRCVTVDRDGALVLETPAGRERFFGGVIRAVD
ncbi:MAG: biotin--[acetyl-CoA-carboxylase] ligase [Pirellulales bacterium]